MHGPQKRHYAAFKAKADMEAAKYEKTIALLFREFGVHASQVKAIDASSPARSFANLQQMMADRAKKPE